MILTEAAPAKVNLALHVRERMGNGYHRLETLFAFTRFGDTLSGEAAEGLSLTVDGPFADSAAVGGDNLVLQAARALGRTAGGVELGVKLRLTKRIPVAAGLGGGSADAAAALRLLRRMWRVDLDDASLEALAAGLGADVPACLRSRACRGEGRGEQLTDLRPWPLAGAPILLVNPRIATPTGPVFAGWDGIDRGPLDAGVAQGRNDLEPPAIALAPVIAEVLDELRQQRGAVLVRMSGSGATCFALFGDAEACTRAAAAVGESRPDWWIEATSLL